jgi:hypothetical protein
MRRLAGELDPPQQLEVARARERLQQLLPGSLAPALDALDDQAQCYHVRSRQRLGLRANVDQEHIVVSHGSERLAEPFQLRP